MDGGSRKYLIASLDQSLKRMGLDYVDIYYHHIQDLNTPLEETMDALAGIVRSGKALYIGLSNYSPERLKEAADILEGMGCRCLLHQHRYSMLARENKKLLKGVKIPESIVITTRICILCATIVSIIRLIHNFPPFLKHNLFLLYHMQNNL